MKKEKKKENPWRGGKKKDEYITEGSGLKGLIIKNKSTGAAGRIEIALSSEGIRKLKELAECPEMEIEINVVSLI